MLGVLSMECVRLDAKLQAKIDVPLAALDPIAWRASGTHSLIALAAVTQPPLASFARRSCVAPDAAHWSDSISPMLSPRSPRPGSILSRHSLHNTSVRAGVYGINGGRDSSVSNGHVNNPAMGIEGQELGSPGRGGGGGGGNGEAGGSNVVAGGSLPPALDVWQYGVLLCILFAEPGEESAVWHETAGEPYVMAAPVISMLGNATASWSPSLQRGSGAASHAITPWQLQSMVAAVRVVSMDAWIQHEILLKPSSLPNFAWPSKLLQAWLYPRSSLA